MAKDPLLPNAPREGDSWESLASNLLGINLNKPLDSEIVSPEELEALELEVDEGPAPDGSAGPHASSWPAPDGSAGPHASSGPAEPPEPAVESPPEAGPAVAEAAEAEPPAEPESEPVVVAGESAAPEGSVAAGGPDASGTRDADRASDPYWDPLAEWKWDEEPSSKRPASRSTAATERRSEPAERELPAVARREEESIVKGPGADARRAAESFDTVSDYRDEYESDDEWEFGAGLLEGVAPPEPAEPKPAEAKSGIEAPPEPPPRPRERDRDERPESRERDRRREEKRERREPAPPPKIAPRPAPAAGAEEDSFAAGLIEAEAPSESAAGEESQEERRPRRRRRRRSRGEPRAESRPGGERTEAKPPAPSDELPTDFDEEEEETVEEGRDESPYRNIPSWEEAIAYLVKTKRSAESGSRSHSSEGRDSSRSDSGGSGRRRRRRPSR